MGMSPLKYHSKSGPTSSFWSAMKPSTDTTACMITVAIPGQTLRRPQTHRGGLAPTVLGEGSDAGGLAGPSGGELSPCLVEKTPVDEATGRSWRRHGTSGGLH